MKEVMQDIMEVIGHKGSNVWHGGTDEEKKKVLLRTPCRS